MLVDIKIKNPQAIKKGSILISNDGKVFEMVDVGILTKDLKSRISTMELNAELLKKQTDIKMKKFISAFMKGTVE